MTDWRRRAACRKVNPQLFDNHADLTMPNKEKTKDRVERHIAARGICATCPVTTECLNNVGPLDEGIRGGQLIEIEEIEE